MRHSGLPYDLVNLHVGDPTPVIQLTKGDCYQAPVIEDLFNHEVIYDKSPAGDDVPRYIDNLAPLMRLFPAEVEGVHRILLHYIENECESRGFKVCDAYWDKWIKNDIERGLHRRHKERKFGVGLSRRMAPRHQQTDRGFPSLHPAVRENPRQARRFSPATGPSTPTTRSAA